MSRATARPSWWRSQADAELAGVAGAVEREFSGPGDTVVERLHQPRRLDPGRRFDPQPGRGQNGAPHGGTLEEGLSINVGGNPNGDQTWVGDFRTILFRVDHQISDKFKESTSFYWPARPAIRNCGEVLGCTPTFDPQKNPDYLGNGFLQRISTHHATQQFDYIISSNMLCHTTAAWDRWVMSGSPLSAGLDWPDRLWGTDKSGIVDKTAGAPNITFTGNIPYTQLGMQWIGYGFEAINRWQFVNDLTWTKGKHTIKVGDEYPHSSVQFPRLGGQHRRNLQLQPDQDGRLRCLGELSVCNRRSIRIFPARTGADRELPDSGIHELERRLSLPAISTTISRRPAG